MGVHIDDDNLPFFLLISNLHFVSTSITFSHSDMLRQDKAWFQLAIDLPLFMLSFLLHGPNVELHDCLDMSIPVFLADMLDPTRVPGSSSLTIYIKENFFPFSMEF